jgi:hypothetical protein
MRAKRFTLKFSFPRSIRYTHEGKEEEGAKMSCHCRDGKNVFRYLALLVLSAALLAASASIAFSDERLRAESSSERFLSLYGAIDEPDLLRAIVLELNEETEEAEFARLDFMERPRAFLAERGVALSDEIFQITAIDIEAGHAAGIFSVAPPQAPELTPTPEGIGFILGNVGVVIQAGAERDSFAPPLDRWFLLLMGIPEETLADLPRALRNLNEAGIDSEELALFREAPRVYLWEKEAIEIDRDLYGIVGLDLGMDTGEVPMITLDERAEGLEVLAEGVAIFGPRIGVFIQMAL